MVRLNVRKSPFVSSVQIEQQDRNGKLDRYGVRQL